MDDTALEHFLSIPDMLKATPREEGGERFVYLEASNQARDFQGEIVLAKALAESADYFLQYGNLDIQHRSIIGLQNNERDYHLHEIGRPVVVQVDGTKTFVKGEIFKGEGQVAECANNYWDSITKLKPAQRWYPSVGGKVFGTDMAFDQGSKGPVKRITKVRWNNIGFSRTPVNPEVPTVSTVPFGVLAKCWTEGGLDLRKALEAGYGTDSATLSGGAALREQSLDPKIANYFDFRNRMAGDLRKGAVGQTAPEMIAHAGAHYGLDPADSAEMTERFIADLRDGIAKKRKH